MSSPHQILLCRPHSSALSVDLLWFVFFPSLPNFSHTVYSTYLFGRLYLYFITVFLYQNVGSTKTGIFVSFVHHPTSGFSVLKLEHCLEWCLVHSRNSRNICWMNEKMNQKRQDVEFLLEVVECALYLPFLRPPTSRSQHARQAPRLHFDPSVLPQFKPLMQLWCVISWRWTSSSSSLCISRALSLRDITQPRTKMPACETVKEHGGNIIFITTQIKMIRHKHRAADLGNSH